MYTIVRRLLLGSLLLAATVLADEGDKYFYVEGSYLDPETALPLDSGAGLQLGIGSELNRLLNLEAPGRIQVWLTVSPASCDPT